MVIWGGGKWAGKNLVRERAVVRPAMPAPRRRMVRERGGDGGGVEGGWDGILENGRMWELVGAVCSILGYSDGYRFE